MNFMYLGGKVKLTLVSEMKIFSFWGIKNLLSRKFEINLDSPTLINSTLIKDKKIV